MKLRLTGALVVGAVLTGVLGACSNDPAATPAQSGPTKVATTVASSAPVSTPPPGSVGGAHTVRILTLSSSAGGGSRLEVVGPEGAKYRLRIGQVTDGCTQVAGKIDAKPLPGLPPNATRHVVVTCGNGADRAQVISTSALLVTAAGGTGFDLDFEIPLDRDL